jgi:hypothetical protein
VMPSAECIRYSRRFSRAKAGRAKTFVSSACRLTALILAIGRTGYGWISFAKS